MIIGSEAIGVMSIGLDDSVIYGARSYDAIPSQGGDKLGGIGIGYINLLAPSTLNITVSGTGIAGRLYPQVSAASLLISGTGDLGFVYGTSSTASLTIGGTTSQTSTQSDVIQPATIVLSTQSLMSWYTKQGQFFDINTAKLTIAGVDSSFYLPASTFSGGANAVVPEIWIG